MGGRRGKGTGPSAKRRGTRGPGGPGNSGGKTPPDTPWGWAGLLTAGKSGLHKEKERRGRHVCGKGKANAPAGTLW